jgi:hypothetical protein
VASPDLFPGLRGQINYPFSPPAKHFPSGAREPAMEAAAQNSEAGPLNSGESTHSECVKLRSSPIRISGFSYPSGKPGFLVVGTVVPRQKPRREKFTSRQEAEQRQGEWETERMRLGAGMRLRATPLSQDALRDAESALAVARKLGFSSLLDAVLAAGKPTAQSIVESILTMKTYQELFDAFIVFHKEHASKSQSDKVRQNAKVFGEHIGWKTQIDKITTSDIQRWLKGKVGGASKKTYNNVLNDLSRVFSWACEPAQGFLKENPANPIPRYSGRVLAHGARQILSAETCSALMSYLEKEHPSWVFPFSLMLFAGLRPGFYEGEIRKLIRCANRDGIETYISSGVLHLTAEITKDRRPRQFSIPSNLAAWIMKYMPAKGKFTMGSAESYAATREKFKIPHDGLRHTAISAHVSKHDRFALAAEQFGNSETVIRRHYFSRMTCQEATAFYQIYPTK